MWRNKTLKEHHLGVIELDFAQSLRGSWESSTLSFMSFGHTNVEICNTLCSEQNVQEFVV